MKLLLLKAILLVLLVIDGRLAAADCNLKRVAILSGDFCTPSIGTISTFEDGSQQFLYAYKLNDTGILQRLCDNKLNCSAWASLGYPRLKPHVVFASDSDTFPLSITTFSFSPSDMTFMVQFLTASQKKELASAASAKYGWFVPPSSIIGLPLSRLECEIDLYDDEGKSFTLYGSAKESLSTPEIVHFPLPTNIAERARIEKHFKSWNSPQLLDPNDGYNSDKLTCLAVHGERNVNRNVVTLSGPAYEKLVDHLFHTGSNVTFVTSKQWRSFVSKMYNALQVGANFRLSLFDFAKMFREELERVGGATKIGLAKWNTTITQLSPFGQHDCTVWQHGNDYDLLVPKACRESQMNRDLRNLLNALPRCLSPRINLEHLENLRAEARVNGYLYLDALDLGKRIESEPNAAGTKTVGQLLSDLNSQPDSDIVWQSEHSTNVCYLSPNLLRGMFFYRNAFGNRFTLPLHVSSYTATFQSRFELPFSKHVILQQAIAEKRQSRISFDRRETLVEQNYKKP